MRIEQIFYTYVYFDPSRGDEPFYVGKGCNGRAWSHLKSKKVRHPFVQRLNKMTREGVQPDIAFICSEEDEEFAHLCEQEAIAKWGRKDLGKGPLLNLTDGGEGVSGVKHPPEVIAARGLGIKKGKNTPTGKINAHEAMKRGWAYGIYDDRVKRQSKPCTLDGVTVYPSRKALWAVEGRRYDFTYV